MLLYPSAANEDWKNILKIFIDKTDKFIFSDLNYSENNIRQFTSYIKSLEGIHFLNNKLIGDFNLKVQKNKTFQEIKAAYFTIKFLYKNVKKEVVFRKGFGQCALYELENGSLKYFCHRGDGTGESGSGVFYLGNRNLKHPPLSRLFDTLTKKLSSNSYIVSDGSNTDFKKLKKVYRDIKLLSKNEVKPLLPIIIKIKDIKLSAIDVLDVRYNHTLIWKVEKLNELL